MNTEKTISRLIDLSPSRKEIELEVPAEDVAREYDRILGEYAGRVKIAGFRKGHAPRDMVKNLFDHEIMHDAYDALIPKVLDEELKALRLDPVNVPEIRDLKHEPGQSLRCVATFEVLPEFELPDYRKVRVAPRTSAVEETEVEKALEDLRAKAAEYVPVEGRGVADGDYAVAEIQGRDAKTKRLLPVEKAVVLAGHADNEPALNEAIRGITPGEERGFHVDYGKDHANRRVAGKSIDYTLKVTEIKEKRVPELNDEFAKSLGDYLGLEDLKARIRKELHESHERADRAATASEVLKEIAKLVNLELPESVVEHETLSVLRRMLSGARQPRVPAEAFEALKAQARAQAVDRLTNHLILDKIARKEGLEVSEEEIQEEIRSLAEANHVSVPALTDMVNREGRRDELKENILFRKTVDFLVKNAIIS